MAIDEKWLEENEQAEFLREALWELEHTPNVFLNSEYKLSRLLRILCIAALPKEARE